MKFILNTNDAELLLQFEVNPSLESLARVLGKDPTVISRQLKRISQNGNFLAKSSGRWKLTELGGKYNQVTRDYLFSQHKVVNNEVHLKVGTTREFCSRILTKHYRELQSILGVNSISLTSFDHGIEQALLSGQVDLAFECGKPYSPDISFERVIHEPISPVVSKKIFKKYQHIKKFKELESLPHILSNRLKPTQFIKDGFQLKNISTFTNDIATTRGLCMASEGWALLPLYTIKDELKSGKLIIINDKLTIRNEKFGVWCLRSRHALSPYYKKAIEWLSNTSDLLEAPQ
jgi:DNA-binding transcriptional LysR family regulator